MSRAHFKQSAMRHIPTVIPAPPAPLPLTSPPGVQVLLAARNASNWLPSLSLPAIERVMAGRRWAFVTLDDGSSDDTDWLLRTHRTTAARRLHLRLQTPCHSVSHAKNAVLALGATLRAEFPVILMVDADDELLPASMEELLPLLGPEADCVVGTHEIIRLDGWPGLIHGDEMVGGGRFEFGTWATLFHHRVIPANGELFQDSNPVHEDAMAYAAMAVSGVRITGHRTAPVYRHHLRRGSVSIKHDEAQMRAAWEHFQARKRHLLTPQAPQAFCSVATRELLRETLVMLHSLRQCHSEPVYLLCDEAVQGAVEKAGLPAVHCRRIEQFPTAPAHWFGYHNKTAVCLKPAALEWALQTHDNALFLDADVVVLQPFGAWPGDLAMAPHHYPLPRARAAEHEAKYGRFNTGMVFCRDREFPAWWQRELPHSQFVDQQCTNWVNEKFAVHPLPPQYNVGFWRLKGLPKHITRACDLAFFCGISTGATLQLGGAPLQSLHIRLFTDMPLFAPMRRMARWALARSAQHAGLWRTIQQVEREFEIHAPNHSN